MRDLKFTKDHVYAEFEEPENTENIKSGEPLGVVFGKIAKWISESKEWQADIANIPCQWWVDDEGTKQGFTAGNENTASGLCSAAIGYDNTASGYHSFALGTGLIASGENQTVIGKNNEEEPYSYIFIIGNGENSSDEDRSNAMAVDLYGNIEISGGIKTLGMSNDLYEHEFDLENSGGILGLIAMGDRNGAYGLYSVAIGTSSCAHGSHSLSIGENCRCSGDYSIAIGKNCSTGDGTYIGHHAISMGENNTSNGTNSVTIGYELIANFNNQTVIGKYNNYDNDCAFVIGNGTDAYSNRSNALTVDWDGNAVFAGDVTATMTDGSTISLIDIYNRLKNIEERLAAL